MIESVVNFILLFSIYAVSVFVFRLRPWQGILYQLFLMVSIIWGCEIEKRRER